jgi:hypothetical protein
MDAGVTEHDVKNEHVPALLRQIPTVTADREN